MVSFSIIVSNNHRFGMGVKHETKASINDVSIQHENAKIYGRPLRRR